MSMPCIRVIVRYIQGTPGAQGTPGGELSIAGPFSDDFIVTPNNWCRIRLLTGDVTALLPAPASCPGASAIFCTEISTTGQLILATADDSAISQYASGFYATSELFGVTSVRSIGTQWILSNFFLGA